MHINKRIIQIIEKLNTENYTQIRFQTHKQKILVSSGIRQGDSLSPILFNLLLVRIIGDVKAAGKKIKIVCYQ